jgi:hypothetical protein
MARQGKRDRVLKGTNNRAKVLKKALICVAVNERELEVIQYAAEEAGGLALGNFVRLAALAHLENALKREQ